MPTDHPLPVDLLDLARRVGVEAAELLVRGLAEHRTEVSTKSSGTDMVTEMDRASEDLIVSALLAERPDDAILGEEGASRRGRSGVRWVIDPIDGTTNYLYERGLGPWDHRAGALVAVEAGATLSDLDGGQDLSAFTLAAAPGVHEPLRALLVEAGAADA